MECKNVPPSLTWLDDAFVKDYVDELEAACCLTEGQDKLLLSDGTYFYQMQPYVKN